jgi:putative transposase
VKDGWDHRRCCRLLELKESRAWRWRGRKQGDRLVDHASGGHAVHGLLPEEQTAIVALFEQWGEVDRSHRKLAHRGSYLGLVWVSPSSVKRVLAAQGLHLRRPARVGHSAKRPFPEWVTYEKNSIWIYDCTHFQHCRTASAVAIMDIVTRKWLVTVVSGEETSTQIQVAFIEALEDEGLLDLIEARANGTVDLSVDDPSRPILLAVSDNGPQMRS